MSSLRRNPNKDWRGQTFNYDAMLAADVSEDYYALSTAQKQLLIAAAQVLGWETRWYSDIDTPIDRQVVRDLADDIVYRLMNPVGGATMYLLRQNVDNSCLLEQSQDGGETWTPAFDYSLCSAGSSQTWNLTLTLNAQMNAARTGLYDGTPQSINQDCPTVFNGDASDFRNKALCMAVKHYVEGQILETLNRYRIAAGLAGLGAGALGLAGGPLGAVIGGIAAGLVGYELYQVERAAADSAARDLVICDLETALEGQAVTEANFQSAINGLSSGTGTRATIVGILKGNRGAQVNYLWFVDLLGSAYVTATTGYNDCPCDNTWCYVFDFALGAQGWEATPGTGGKYYATWQGNGFKTGSQSIEGIIIRRTFPASAIINTFYLYLDTPIPSTKPDRGTMHRFDAASNPPSVVRINNGSGPVYGVTVAATNVSGFTVGVDTWHAGSQVVTNASKIIKVVLKGTGTNPFGTNNCPSQLP